MFIQTDNYMFPIRRDGDTYYLEQCLIVEIVNDTAILQDLLYRSKCSPEKELERNLGTQEMVKGFLKFVLGKRKDVTVVYFTDNSTTVVDGKRRLLADWKWYTEGKTWYEKHFGAVPHPSTIAILRKHIEVKKQGLKPPGFTNSEIDRWLPKQNVKDLKPIYGSLWEIPRETIMAYNVNVNGHRGSLGSMVGGGYEELTRAKTHTRTKWWFGYIY